MVQRVLQSLLIHFIVLGSCFKFPSTLIRYGRTATNFQIYMQDGSVNNFNSNQNYTSPNKSLLAPVNDVNSFYRNNGESEIINTAFIPTGPSSLSTVDKTSNTIKNEAYLKSKSATAKRYFELVEKLSPNELLQKFAESAPRNVQEATKSTIVSILGSLPSYALDAALITTSTKLANLLYQMQLTGYMFKSAEYRMSLTRSLKGYPKLPAPATINMDDILGLTDANSSYANTMLSSSNTIYPFDTNTRITGKVQVTTASGETVEVNADDLMKSLSREVQELRTEIATIRDSRETELRSNLLTYIQALPERDLARLTQDMSEDVVESIKMLVNALMERLGVDITGPEVIIQQPIGAMAQLCMWQMVIGYKLREFEAFEKGVTFSNE